MIAPCRYFTRCNIPYDAYHVVLKFQGGNSVLRGGSWKTCILSDHWRCRVQQWFPHTTLVHKANRRRTTLRAVLVVVRTYPEVRENLRSCLQYSTASVILRTVSVFDLLRLAHHYRTVPHITLSSPSYCINEVRTTTVHANIPCCCLERQTSPT